MVMNKCFLFIIFSDGRYVFFFTVLKTELDTCGAFSLIITNTDYRYVCVCKEKVKVRTGQYIKWLESFTTYKNLLKPTSYLLPLYKPVKPVLLNDMQNLFKY